MTMSTQTTQDLPVVGLPWGSSWIFREVQTRERLTRDGDPLVLLTESPDSDVARVVCGGHWNWHTLCLVIRGLPAFDLDPGITYRDLDGDQRRFHVVGPGGQMIVERVRRSA